MYKSIDNFRELKHYAKKLKIKNYSKMTRSVLENEILASTSECISNNMKRNWKIENVLVNRERVKIFTVCDKYDCHYIMKIAKKLSDRYDFDFDIENEVYYQKKFSRIGLALPIYDYWFCTEGASIIMEKATGNVNDYVSELRKKYNNKKLYKKLDNILKNISEKLKCLHEHNYCHGDFTPLNVVYLKKKNKIEWYIIDFEHTRKDTKDRQNADITIFGKCFIRDFSGELGYHLCGKWYSLFKDNLFVE